MNRLLLLLPIIVVMFGMVIPVNADERWIDLSKDLQAYQSPTEKWIVAGDARLDPENPKRLIALPGSGVLINGKEGGITDLRTREKWGDLEITLAFMIAKGSNSGVKLHGAYEIQIRDSKNSAKGTGDDCGGIYPRAENQPGKYRFVDDGIAPRVNACKAAGEWQTLEIKFRAPRFDKDGKKVANARFDKVVLNGKLIHENVEVKYPTGHYWHNKEHAVGPLLLQGDHGPVAFRNVRVRPLVGEAK